MCERRRRRRRRCHGRCQEVGGARGGGGAGRSRRARPRGARGARRRGAASHAVVEARRCARIALIDPKRRSVRTHRRRRGRCPHHEAWAAPRRPRPRRPRGGGRRRRASGTATTASRGARSGGDRGVFSRPAGSRRSRFPCAQRPRQPRRIARLAALLLFEQPPRGSLARRPVRCSCVARCFGAVERRLQRTVRSNGRKPAPTRLRGQRWRPDAWRPMAETSTGDVLDRPMASEPEGFAH